MIWARLSPFYERCADSGLPELERLATTVSTWRPEILAFIDTGITNAGSEGTNRVIKTVARDAYGFRNPVNQRLRTRCATTRRGRGCLNHA
ncbi:transposase [Saccharothrix sp. ALI-22-I]|uniref:transposase n=1 Tax=Saccharothrix sp. ALI-22-I TaxID=1933778 RepID=UPI001931125B|nr:transposase [Saccharothrix sp. ALI-22-I]